MSFVQLIYLSMSFVQLNYHSARCYNRCLYYRLLIVQFLIVSNLNCSYNVILKNVSLLKGSKYLIFKRNPYFKGQTYIASVKAVLSCVLRMLNLSYN